MMDYGSYSGNSFSYPLRPMFCGCGMPSHEEHRRDCFFYDEDHDMGATIPCCSYHGGYGNCPCEGCSKYIYKGDARELVKIMLDKGEIGQNGKNGQTGNNSPVQ